MPSIKLSNALKERNNPVYSIIDTIVSSTTSTLSPDLYGPYDDDGEGEIWSDRSFHPPTDRHHQFVTPSSPGKHNPMMSMAVLMLIVVASLSLVVGAIYMLIYFKSIKPMSARSRSYVDQGGKTDDDGGRSKSAHPFFRRK